MKMKQQTLKLTVEKLPKPKPIRFTMELSPEQNKAIKMMAVNKGTNVKAMILEALGIKI
jgi:hypothetical protein